MQRYRCRDWRLARSGLLAVALPLCAVNVAQGSQQDSEQSQVLKKMSLDELLNVEVTSVSRRPEKLTNAASAIQVITREDIRRSGAIDLPEALRLAPNLQVAQVNASQWAISARGFNNVLADKLLVMIDGRTVYTPSYAGVYWDAQDVLLEDVDRIEVISGPGSSLWGANAVNGVINISTLDASKTQGIFAEGSVGNELRSAGSLRYGGQLTPDLAFRVYAKAFDMDDTTLLNGADAHDAWHMKQAGFRSDWNADNDTLTLQGDYYQGNPNPDGAIPTATSGGNVLSRWSRKLSDSADLQLQFYYDHTMRDFGNGFAEALDTYDLDWQNKFLLSQRQQFIWGIDVRVMNDDVTNLPLFGFFPGEKTLHLYSVFLQDEIALINDKLNLTFGAKFEHNDYTGLETQPSARLAWTPTEQQTIWTAASRAVRTPARIDRDFQISLTPTIPLISGADFESESVRAYELGWRLQPNERLTLSLASFYNQYDDLRSAEPGPNLPPLNLPITFANGVDGDTYGLESSATYAVNDYWQLRGGYTWLQKHLRVKPYSHDLNNGTSESNDPENQVLLQSMLSLPHKLELDSVLRYVDTLSTPHVDSYLGLDVRIAWRAMDSLELALVGQNLLDSHHAEFVPTSPSPREIERSIYGKITWRY